MSGIIDSKDSNVTNAGKLVTLDFYDKLGYKYTAKFRVNSTTQDGEFTMNLTDITDSEGEPLKKSDGTAMTDADLQGIFAKDTLLKFDTTTGKITNAGTSTDLSLTLDFTSAGVDSMSGVKVNIDCKTLVDYNNNGASTITCTRGDTDGVGSGRKLGEMSGVSIQKDGKIYATYDNGQSRLLGQIATAQFANASGLEKRGDNLYSATQNSGDFDNIGVDITAGGGYMNSGVLEMSNVDLSAEFTEMITTQRGFQANSRIITVSDTLLEELTNLKR